MNTTYLTILACPVLFFLTEILRGKMKNASEDRCVLYITTVGVFVIMLMFSFIFPLGYDTVTSYPATNTKVGTQLIIQSDGAPTQIVTDIAFIDKLVSIEKVIENNAWGSEVRSYYRVVSIKTEL